MTYPNSLGYQPHSETSRMAADQCSTAASTEQQIVAYLDSHPSGLIGDEVARIFDIPIGTASARLRGLELKGMIVKTESTRLTRSNRKAFVYISKKRLDSHLSMF